jgi:hypothetical protein
MPLIISESIRKREFKRGKISAEDLSALLRTARFDLGTLIKGSQLPSGTQLIKAYATTPNGPRRVVYLLAVEQGDLFLLFYRSKNDPIGRNITIHNPVFKKALHDHLDLLLTDISEGHLEIHEIPFQD